MAEIRGCDLVVEYLIKEKVPYLFGYAGHGAVGLLDGVYNHQDELKIIFPRTETAAAYTTTSSRSALRSDCARRPRPAASSGSPSCRARVGATVEAIATAG